MQITQMLLTINKYSRPGTQRKKTTKIAVHYVGNPGSTATGNRNYFEDLKRQVPDSTGKWWINADGTNRTYNGEKIAIRWVSSNYIIGLDGEIIQCVPDDEIAYCTNQANAYSVSIECCHPDSTGKFTEKTEKACAELCAFLVNKYGLTVDDVIRHYDVTKKQCPLWYTPTKYQSATVANQRWNGFKAMIKECLIREYNTKIEKAENSEKFTPFIVKIICDKLNVRKAPGTQSEVVMTVPMGYKYTIVEVQTVGTVPWGRLKSGCGWISLNEKYAERC